MLHFGLRSREHVGEENVGEQDEDAAGDDGIGARLAHFHAAAFDGVAFVGRDAGDDEGIDDGLNHAAPEEPLVELIAEALGQFWHGGGAEQGGGIGANDACRHTQRDEDGHDGHEARNLGQDEEVGRIDAHDVEGVNLLGDAHRADFGSDVGADLASQDEAHDARRELEEHDFAGGVAHHHAGHPGALDVQFDLEADDGSDEERDDEHDAYRIVAQLIHFSHILTEEHPPSVGLRKHSAHQQNITAQMGQSTL